MSELSKRLAALAVAALLSLGVVACGDDAKEAQKELDDQTP
jgi:hypothetical protein